MDKCGDCKYFHDYCVLLDKKANANDDACDCISKS